MISSLPAYDFVVVRDVHERSPNVASSSRSFALLRSFALHALFELLHHAYIVEERCALQRIEHAANRRRPTI
jgi:hypothetical protein